ncbi:MAG TPA: hypothetical protein DCL65_09180 [Chryseobacterium sp.]|uniref:Uncharacterized protein n=1 Tax=Kaistella yananensis TaxID=2989820 RepID=A0ABT3JM77_9FLAO|nr:MULTISPECIES: hypothetical protein [Chryseobacterium group]MCW4451784.1 hypothetical protein [Kaistella yananensis]OWR15651.1 hypothetical protein CDW55_04405 [Chryseobacterium sp. VAUSW3]HAI81186.1 hypothetical protein [Chryseobacterium sp.]
MNTQVLTSKLEKLGIMILTFFFSVMAFAQDATKSPDLNVDVTTTKTTSTTEEWFTNPLYWVIGALVLIIIIALAARGGGKRD